MDSWNDFVISHFPISKKAKVIVSNSKATNTALRMERPQNRIREKKELEWELECKKQSNPNQ